MRTIIVGGGTAGCVLAARLSQDPHHEVVLVEAGAGLVHAASKSGDYLSAIETPELSWPGPPVRGRGLGGTSQINGMVAMLGRRVDYDRWAELGAKGWSWNDLGAAVGRVLVPRRRCVSGEMSSLDLALIEAAGGDPLAGAAELTWDGGQRWSVVDCYLTPALSRPNLVLRGTTTVKQILVRDATAYGVEFDDGETLLGDEVIVCAGAFGSPEMLRRSAVAVPGGFARRLDHDSVARAFVLNEPHHGPLVGGALAHNSVERELQALPIARGHLGSLTVGVFDGGLADAHSWLDALLAHPRLAAAVEAVGPVTPGGYSHGCGTIPLGSRLDSSCGVIGYRNLRVCDASVFPSVPRANPMLSVIVVAERLVEILQDARL